MTLETQSERYIENYSTKAWYQLNPFIVPECNVQTTKQVIVGKWLSEIVCFFTIDLKENITAREKEGEIDFI